MQNYNKMDNIKNNNCGEGQNRRRKQFMDLKNVKLKHCQLENCSYVRKKNGSDYVDPNG